MASIYKRRYTASDGTVFTSKKWRINYKDEHGQLRTVAGFRYKRATQQFAEKLEHDCERLRAGLPVYEGSDPRPLRAAVDAYCDELTRRGRSASHVYNERGFMTRLADACNWKFLDQVRQPDLARFLADLQKAGKSPRTQNAYRDSAATFCKWCVRQRWLPENPLAEVPKAKIAGRRPRRRRALTLEEFNALTSPRSCRHLVYRVAGLSGLRHEELVLIERRDYTLGDSPQWHLREEITKGRRCDRVPMLPECATVLADLSKGLAPTDRIFRSVPISRTFNADLKRAQIPKRDDTGRQADFHSLRYFFCTLTGGSCRSSS
jgi:integrase